MKKAGRLIYIVSDEAWGYRYPESSETRVRFFPMISQAFSEFQHTIPDLMIIDLEKDSLMFSEYCFSIKSNANYSETNILFLGDKKDEETEIKALSSGADDFIYKPVSNEVLTLRINKLLNIRNSNGSLKSKENKTNNKIVIDPESFTVRVNNQLIEVSKREFELLQYMASAPGKVFTREDIFENVWKRKPEENERTLDVHILRLRKKLGENCISTQKGVGYRFRPE